MSCFKTPQKVHEHELNSVSGPCREIYKLDLNGFKFKLNKVQLDFHSHPIIYMMTALGDSLSKVTMHRYFLIILWMSQLKNIGLLVTVLKSWSVTATYKPNSLYLHLFVTEKLENTSSLLQHIYTHTYSLR